MKLNKEDYTARVANASPLQLTIINFELIIAYIEESAEAEKYNDIGAFLNNMSGAKDFLKLLMTSLDMKYDLSKELMRIYIYINGLLIKSEYSKSAKQAVVAADMLKLLLESFKSISETEQSETAVMQNAQQVYAGLTYKDGKLSEYIEEDLNRGFKA